MTSKFLCGGSAAFVLCLALAGCGGTVAPAPVTSASGTPTPAPPAQPTVLSDIGTAVGIVHTVAGDVSAAVANACTVAAPALGGLSTQLKGGALNTLASVQAGCTLAGQVQMTLNDQAPVSPTNSGNSPAWVTDTTAGLQLVAALAPAADAATLVKTN